MQFHCLFLSLTTRISHTQSLTLPGYTFRHTAFHSLRIDCYFLVLSAQFSAQLLHSSCTVPTLAAHFLQFLHSSYTSCTVPAVRLVLWSGHVRYSFANGHWRYNRWGRVRGAHIEVDIPQNPNSQDFSNLIPRSVVWDSGVSGSRGSVARSGVGGWVGGRWLGRGLRAGVGGSHPVAVRLCCTP